MDKTKKPTAFEQSLQKIHSDSQALYDQSQKVSLPVLHDLFMKALHTFQQSQKAKTSLPQDRAKKGSFNISNLQNGQILKSDGSVDQPQQGEDNSFQANTQPQSALSALMEHLAPSNPAVQEAQNPESFNRPPQTPTEQMTQDLLHSLDTTGQPPQAGVVPDSYPVEEGADNQPNEFYAGLRGKTGTPVLDNIKDFLDKRLVDSQNQFSQGETPVEPKVSLGPLKNSYGAIFRQTQPTQQANPNVPVGNVWQNLLKDWQKQDEFYG